MIEPFASECVSLVGYDLRVGDSVYVADDGFAGPDTLEARDEAYVLLGEFTIRVGCGISCS